MTTLYKITGPTGDPIHSGTGAWSLPHEGQPGEWREVTGDLVKCANGLHLTDEPARWWAPECRVFEAEAEGVVGSCDDDEDRKVVCRRARLTREVSREEQAELRIYYEGEHKVTGLPCVAAGSSSVEAWDSSRVEAKDSVIVISWRGTPGVKITERAVWIDRGDESGPPVVHVAEPKP